MMQSISNKHCDGGRLSLWFPTKQPHHSLPNSFQMENEYNFSHLKLSVSQDSSSTLSNLEAANSAKSDIRSQNISFQPGFEKISSAYEPNAVVYPQMMGLGVPRTRVILPLDCTDGIDPVYVNSKQYHAILRRRQTRAKLEARNKITKSRKPYLHESRHLHALKRVRGSGGRFVNTKNDQKPKITFSERAIQHSERNHSWGPTNTSSSGMSCIFNNDDIFPQPDLGISIDSLTAQDNSLALSIDGYTRIRNAT